MHFKRDVKAMIRFLPLLVNQAAVNLIQMCSLVCVLSMDESLIVLGVYLSAPFLGPQRRHRTRRQRRLCRPPHAPADSARTRGPLTGARATDGLTQ